MYLDEYKRWLAADLEDADLKPELAKVEGNATLQPFTSNVEDLSMRTSRFTFSSLSFET